MLRHSTAAPTALVAALLGLLVPAAPISAAPSVDAGADLQAVFPDATLEGAVGGLEIVDFWTADGDGALENHVITYHGVSGLGAFGPLRDTLAQIWGWPSDLIEIGGTVYGVDTFWEQLYTVDPTTGIVTPLTAPLGNGNWDTRLGSLAYDPATDRIYAVDWRPSSNRLFAIDRATGATIPPGGGALLSGLPFADVLGLAWDATSGLLYLYDANSGEIHTLDPDTGTTAFVVEPDHWPGGFYDELAFYDGELFGTLSIDDAGVNAVQVRRIDLATGEAWDVGPTIQDTDSHSLLIHSLPKRVAWSVDSGPGHVTFADPADPGTMVTFSRAGTYVLRLTVHADPPVSDSVTVTSLTASKRAPVGAAWARPVLIALLVATGLGMGPRGRARRGRV